MKRKNLFNALGICIIFLFVLSCCACSGKNTEVETLSSETDYTTSPETPGGEPSDSTETTAEEETTTTPEITTNEPVTTPEETTGTIPEETTTVPLTTPATTPETTPTTTPETTPATAPNTTISTPPPSTPPYQSVVDTYAVNYDVTYDDEVCEYYAINSRGNAVECNTKYGATWYLPLYDADTLCVRMTCSPIDRYGLAFYGENKEFISFQRAPTESEIKVVDVVLSVPANAKYFRTTYYNYDNRVKYGEFTYSLKKNGNIITESFRDYQDGYIFFSREVSQTKSVTDTSDVEVTTCALALPENYSATGTPTKLIIYFHGYSHYTYYGTWGSTDSFKTKMQHYTDRGYAVLGCNGARDNNKKNHFTSAGSSQYTDGYWQAYKYAIENYNLDKNVYVVGSSAGGPAAINFARWHQESVNGLMLLSTWTDIKICSWGQGVRDTFVEYLGFNNTSVYENDKAYDYDPANLIKVGQEGEEYIDTFTIPVYGIIGSTETSHVLYNPFIRWMNAVINGNSNSKLKIWQGKGHTLASHADADVDTETCNFFDLL